MQFTKNIALFPPCQFLKGGARNVPTAGLSHLLCPEQNLLVFGEIRGFGCQFADSREAWARTKDCDIGLPVAHILQDEWYLKDEPLDVLPKSWSLVKGASEVGQDVHIVHHDRTVKVLLSDCPHLLGDKADTSQILLSLLVCMEGVLNLAKSQVSRNVHK